MINTKQIISIIPARKNSKRLKNKNLLKINSKPLIYWSIQAALNSKYIDKVVLSTESKEIAKIGAAIRAVFLTCAADRRSWFSIITTNKNNVITAPT